MIKKLGLLIWTIFTCSSCNEIKTNYDDIKELKLKIPTIDYPFKLPNNIVDSLKNNSTKLDSGLFYRAVLEIMGAPNEINYTLDKNNWNQVVGFSFVYLINRNQTSGSANDKDEKLIRLLFDSNKCLTRIDYNGL